MNSDQSPVKTLSVLDEDAVPIAGGKLEWVPLRRRLGIGAFGINAYRAANEGDAVVEEHVESPGQEEIYVVVRGRARFVVGEETIEVATGSAVFVPEPGVQRAAVALEDGTVVLAVGGWRDRAYHSLPWEPIYLAQESMRREDWAEAAETLEREAGEHLETAIIQFRLASCHARLGEHELAMEELRRAVEINPKMIDRAATDEGLAPLQGRDDWPAA